MGEFAEPNIFMLCDRVCPDAFRELPCGYSVRLCRKEELPVWEGMLFDDCDPGGRLVDAVRNFYRQVYEPFGDLFFDRCLFVVDSGDVPVATAFIWKAYCAVTTLHWFKVRAEYQNRGIGRALLSVILGGLRPGDYPVLLHTQPSSNRAIKLYSDFGFKILTDARVGNRNNDIENCLAELRSAMPFNDFSRLSFAEAPEELLTFLAAQEIHEF